jgi:hypothetical protein
MPNPSTLEADRLPTPEERAQACVNQWTGGDYRADKVADIAAAIREAERAAALAMRARCAKVADAVIAQVDADVLARGDDGFGGPAFAIPEETTIQATAWDIADAIRILEVP